MWFCSYAELDPDRTEEEISEFLRALFSLLPTHIPYAIVPRPWCGRKKWPETAFTVKKKTNIAFNILCSWQSIDIMQMREDLIDSIAYCIENENDLIGILLAPRERDVQADLKYHNIVFPDYGGIWIENMDHLVDLEGYLFLGNDVTCWPGIFLHANDKHLPILESPLIKKYWTEQRDLRDVKVQPLPGCLGCLGLFLKWIAGRLFK
jgi:hypothetical protein